MTATKKVAFLIDHSNLWPGYGVDVKHGIRKVDCVKLVNILAGSDRSLYKAIFLNRGLAGNEVCRLLDEGGFETFEKQLKIIHYKGGMKQKCNLDVELAVVGMQMLYDREEYPEKPEKIFIVSGDSDYEMLAETMIRAGVEVEFAAYKVGLAKELKKNFNIRELDELPIW